MSEDSNDLLTQLHKQWEEAQGQEASARRAIMVRADDQVYSPVLYELKARLSEIELFCKLLESAFQMCKEDTALGRPLETKLSVCRAYSNPFFHGEAA